jgi:hypothetical protein
LSGGKRRLSASFTLAEPPRPLSGRLTNVARSAWFPLESEGRHSHAIANRERARINSDTMIVMLSASARHAVALVIAREKREIQ